MARQVPIFDPFRMLSDDLFTRPFGSIVSMLNFPVDMYENDKEVTVEMEVPGYTKEQIDISVRGKTLVVSGRKEDRTEEKDPKGKILRQEISRGEFSQNVSLPSLVDAEGTRATLKDGILRIMMSKAPEALDRKIAITE